VTRTVPLGVNVIGVCSVDVMEDLREVAPGGLQQEMVMVVHETVGMDDGSISIVG